MIAMLTGRSMLVDEDGLIFDVRGVGYHLRATTGAVQAAVSASGDVTLHVYTHVREESLQLFGFGTLDERRVFERLLGLQGVGPKVALSIVSAYSPADIQRAANNEDTALFESISGIGPKVARRIVTELKDKLAGLALTHVTTMRAEVGDSFLESRDALVGLGMSLPQAEQALKDTDPDAPVDARIRQALQAGRA